MRILFVNPWGLWEGYSGPVTLLTRLLDGLASTSQDSTTLLTPSIDGRQRRDDVPGQVRTISRRSSPAGFSRAEQARWAFSVAWFLIRHRREYDAVHFQGMYVNAYPGLLVAQACGLVTIVLPVVEGGELGRTSGTGPGALALRFKARITRTLLARVSVAFYLSPGIRAELVAAGAPSSAVAFLGNPVDTAVFRPSSTPPARPGLVLGFVGMVGHRKGADVVLEALALVRERGVAATALFVGPFESRDFETAFSARSQELRIADHIRVLPYIPAHSVADAMREMDVFLLPSLSEGMPGALVEAMASGLPAVVTDVGGMGDAVRQATAGAVVPRDPSAIASAIVSLADERPRHSAAAAARRYAVANYSVEAVVHAYRTAVSRAMGSV